MAMHTLTNTARNSASIQVLTSRTTVSTDDHCWVKFYRLVWLRLDNYTATLTLL